MKLETGKGNALGTKNYEVKWLLLLYQERALASSIFSKTPELLKAPSSRFLIDGAPNKLSFLKSQLLG